MSLLWKIGIIGFLVLLIFGGGGFAAYELFFKKPAAKASAGNQAVVTPTPDPGPALLSQAQQLMAKGDSEHGKELLISIFQSFPASSKAAEAKKIVGSSFPTRTPLKPITWLLEVTRLRGSREKPKLRRNSSSRPMDWRV
jgi:hypothetical protein